MNNNNLPSLKFYKNIINNYNYKYKNSKNKIDKLIDKNNDIVINDNKDINNDENKELELKIKNKLILYERYYNNWNISRYKKL